MTNQEANKKVTKLFNRFKKLKQTTNSEQYYKDLEVLKKDCYALYKVIDVFYILSPLNAVKIASINSTIRFVQPYLMLMQLQKTVNVY